MSNPKPTAKSAREFKKKLRVMIKEYVDEAEHQDGIGYWNNFVSVEDAFQDMARYAQEAEKTTSNKVA